MGDGKAEGVGKEALPDRAAGAGTAGAGTETELAGLGEGVADEGVAKDGRVEGLAGLAGEALPLETELGAGLAGAGLGVGLAASAGLGARLGVELATGAGLGAGVAASATGEGGSSRTQVSVPATPSACKPADRWKAATAFAVLS